MASDQEPHAYENFISANKFDIQDTNQAGAKKRFSDGTTRTNCCLVIWTFIAVCLSTCATVLWVYTLYQNDMSVTYKAALISDDEAGRTSQPPTTVVGRTSQSWLDSTLETPVNPCMSKCIKGDTGPVGPSGPQGSRGYPGTEGFPGSKGDIGHSGFHGMDGEPGLPGMSGLEGHKGEAGYPGERGNPGFAGRPGSPGAPGPTGSTDGIGSSYIHWGRRECPDTASLVYSGYAAGAHYESSGSGSNYLCLHEDPQFVNSVKGVQTGKRAQISGAEFEVLDFPPLAAEDNHDVPCAVCRVSYPRGTMVMIPGKTTCPTGWTSEYYGYLMSARHDQKRAEYICMDGQAESTTESHASANENGALFYPVEVRCYDSDLDKYQGGLPCEKFPDGNELSCVVCTV